MTSLRLLTTAAIMVVGVLLVGTAAAARLTKSEYVAMLRTADAASAKADNAAAAALQAHDSTAAQIRAAFYAMGKTHLRIGLKFAAISPPRAAAKANGDFAHAEIVLGRQNEAIALRLPKTKQAILKYVQSLNPSGGNLLDRAVAELHAAGFTSH